MLSRPTTLSPRASNALARREPTNPATPVTKTFMPSSLTRRQFFTTHTCDTLEHQTPNPKPRSSRMRMTNWSILILLALAFSRARADLPQNFDADYPALADAQHRALAGLSMGGSQPLRGGLPNLKLFSYLGCFSSMLRDPFPEAIEKVLADADTTNSKLKLFYLSTGDKDKNF